MSAGATILALLVLGGAGYGTYRVMNDPELLDRMKPRPAPRPKYNRWAYLEEDADGHRYVAFIEADGSKGFSAMRIRSRKNTATNDLSLARDAMEETARSAVEEAEEYAAGKHDSLRGITSQTIGVYDVQAGRVVDKYDIKTPPMGRRR